MEMTTTQNSPRQIAPAEGPLGILLVGLGAVATTFVAGVESVRRGLSEPIGSLTEMKGAATAALP